MGQGDCGGQHQAAVTRRQRHSITFRSAKSRTLMLCSLWDFPLYGVHHQTVTADTLARNIEIAGDSRTVIRRLTIVSASERQQIAALATKNSFSRRHLADGGMSRPAKRGGVPPP